jgi:hypothetical protein
MYLEKKWRRVVRHVTQWCLRKVDYAVFGRYRVGSSSERPIVLELTEDGLCRLYVFSNIPWYASVEDAADLLKERFPDLPPQMASYLLYLHVHDKIVTAHRSIFLEELYYIYSSS